MGNKITIITVIIIIIIIFLGAKVMTPRGWQTKLVSPGFLGLGKQQIPTPSPTPSIKQFKFDSSSILDQELESVNPEVKDSDFEELKKLIEQI